MPPHQRGWGLLLEDELKTDLATLIQDAYRGLTATAFYLVASVTHDVAIHGREHVSGYHPTIFLSNHKRDLDSLVVVSILYFARGISHPDRRAVFALREDAFWPNFMDYLALPGPLARLLHGLRVTPYIRMLKAYPVGYLTSRQDLRRVRGQLAHLAWLLDHGRDLFWTPEGGLGLDGRLEPFMAGFHRIVEDSRAPLRMLPIAVMYDFMTTARTRCFVRFGPEMDVDRGLSHKALEAQASQAIRRQMTANAGHLAAAVLRDWPAGERRTTADIREGMLAKARQLRAAGQPLDGRLTMRWSFDRRLRRFLGYAERRRILRRDGAFWTVREGLDHPQMRYVANELRDIEMAAEIDG